LATPKVWEFVDPICLLGRQKSRGNARKKKYSYNMEPTFKGTK